MAHVDLVFMVRAKTIPQDHSYSLYAAISRLVPLIHGAKDVGIFPIKGTPGRPRELICEQSALRIRLPADRIPQMLPLAGKELVLDGHKLRVGVPQVHGLVPAVALYSPLVILKFNRDKATGAPPEVTPERFLALARSKLTRPPDPDNSPRGGLGFPTELQVSIPLAPSSKKPGEPARRVIRVKGKTEVGYALQVSGLSAEESVMLQELGLGGRRLLGCGSFLPLDSI